MTTLAVMAASAMLSIAATPEPASIETGECLAVQAYVTVSGGQHGVTNYTCLVPADCDTELQHHQQQLTVGPIGAGGGVRIPWPTASNTLCYP